MKSLWRVVTATSNLWPFYLVIAILSIAVSLIAQTSPLLIGAIIGELQQVGTTDIDKNLIWIFVALLFAQDIATTLISNVQGYFGDIMAVKIQNQLSTQYYQHLLTLPQAYYDDELTGSITARLNRGIVGLSGFTQSLTNGFIPFILTALFSLGIVAFISWPIALVLASLYPIFVYMTIKTSGKWMVYQQQKNQNQDIAFGRFQEVISQVKVTKSFGQESGELSFFNRTIKKILDLTYPQSKLWHAKDIQRNVVLNVVMGATFALIAYQAVEGELSLVQAVTLIQFSALIRLPIFTISFLVDNFQKAIADSRDYFSAMDQQPAITDIEGARKLRVTNGSISLDKIEFSYGDKKIIRDWTAAIEPGTKVALVGESGEGKTTISNLLLRLYDLDGGSIKIDGQDIGSVTQASLRKNIGVVFQDASLFSGTIKENISYGMPRATKKQVIAAAKAANAHEFISKLNKGYDALIGERGLKLSGGQKQRIAIARALLKDAPILILDEATSSLDNKSEVLVQQALERLMDNRTTIIIAHRLSTIQNVDKIISLKGGRVEEIGSPKQLSKSGGTYQRLLEVQSASDPKARKKALAKYGIAA